MLQFLGKTIPREEITLEVAKNVPAGSFAAAIADASPADRILGSTAEQAGNDPVHVMGTNFKIDSKQAKELAL
jgi:hypothetical protein